MRFLGVDYGRRRIGLAWSDDSATLARPWQTIAAGATPVDSALAISRAVDGFLSQSGEDAIAGVVLGLPRRLNGEDTDQTAVVRQVAELLDSATCPVHLQDERLTSREAEDRLAVRERDWRARKKQIDAAAAAIILQDFLDARAPRLVSGPVARVGGA
jgi:putative Holliday junction resolvase